MKIFILGILGSLYIQSSYSSDGPSCQQRWDEIQNRYKRDFDEKYKEAETAWSNANYAKRQRGNILPGQQGGPTIQEWKSSVTSQGYSIDRAARKLEEARRIYDYYERRRPTSGFQSYFWWKNQRKTWYSVDIEELISDRSCLQQFTTYQGRSVSIRLAAQNFDRDVKRKTSQMIRRVRKLREMADWLEESEIKRLAPERYTHCTRVARNYVHPTIVREFCGEIDSVGYQKLMPFVGCVSNLRYWGYENGRTTRYSIHAYGQKNIWSTKFFDACKEMDNIEAMLSGDSWSRCMRSVVRIYSFAGDAARYCTTQQTVAVRSAPTRDTSTGLEIDRSDPWTPEIRTSRE